MPSIRTFQTPASLMLLTILAASCERAPVALEEAPLGDRSAMVQPFFDDPCPQLTIPVPDPITKTDFPFHVRIEYVTGPGVEPEEEGIMYMPAKTPQPVPAPGQYPLVILLHATGYSHDWYNDLQKHLARNGFAITSINWNPFDGPNAVNVILDHLDYLFNSFQYKNQLFNNIALVGHSRGGKYVVPEAHNVANQGYNVRSVVALAPAPQSADDVVVPYPSKSLLVMFCSRDADQAANGTVREALAPYTDVKQCGFFTYDVAGPFTNEFTTGLGQNFWKTMIYLDGGGHWAFASFYRSGANILAVGPQWLDMAKGYMNAYLRWALLSQAPYNAYFKFQDRPASLDNGIEVATQYSSRFRKVIENFEDNTKLTNTIGGTNILQWVTVRHDWSVQLNMSSPHATRLYEVAWQHRPPFVPKVIFPIPAGRVGDPGSPRNFTGAKHLSFRVGQIRLDPLNPTGEDQDFFVYLESGDGAVSPALKVSHFGRIHYPFFVFPSGSPHSEMSTVLIPLCEFVGVDLSNVSRIVFEFAVGGHSTGKVQIDNIEVIK